MQGWSVNIFDSLSVILGLPLILVSILSIKSLLAFSYTGPEIQKEIRSKYLLYSVMSFLRLIVWAYIILLWITLLSVMVYIAWSMLNNANINTLFTITAAVSGILTVTCYQFIKHLLLIPSSIMMSSHYSMTRFIPLWRHLSITRLRWFQLLIIIGAGILFFKIGRGLIETGNNEIWLFISLVGLIILPYIYAIWPMHLTLKKQFIRKKKPNILMIGCDTLRADRLGNAGYTRNLTPFIDSLCRKSTFFSNCHTPLARTAPSLISILTGTCPYSHGIRTNFIANDKTKLKYPDLASILSNDDYTTVAISDWAGSDMGKFSFGFQYKDLPFDQWNLKFLIRQGPKDLRLFLTLFTHNQFGKTFLPELYYLAGIPLTKHLGEITKKWVSKLSSDPNPFFVNLFMGTTHPPFGSEWPYYNSFSDKDYKGESKFGMSRLTDPFEIIRSQKEPKESFDLEQITDIYDGSVRNFDDEVRRIIHHLKACDQFDNTIIVIYSDHGMEFFEHNTWGQGNNAIANASSHVPLIIFDPRNQQQVNQNKTVRTTDIAPTILDLIGNNIPNYVDGTSLSDYMKNDNNDKHLHAYFETGIWLATPPGTDPDHIVYPEILELLEIPDIETGTLSIKEKYYPLIISARDRMVRNDKWKLVYLPMKGTDRFLLFNLENDKLCNNDVADSHPDVVMELKALLIKIMEKD